MYVVSKEQSALDHPDGILTLDPGGTTGASMYVPLTNSVEVWQVEACDTANGLRHLIETLRVRTLLFKTPHVVFENFEFRHDETYRDKIDYTPAEVIGAIRAWHLDYPYVKLIRTSASMGKGFWTDDKIKKTGLWVPGMEHAMDALRHQLRYRAFDLGHRYLFNALKPEDRIWMPEEKSWKCPRCGSDRWVAVSLTGPINFGGRAIKQCVPCGNYSNDPV